MEQTLKLTPSLCYNNGDRKRKSLFSLLQNQEKETLSSNYVKGSSTEVPKHTRNIGLYFRNHQLNQGTNAVHSNEPKNDLEPSICSNIIYGVPINGFHPQLNSLPNKSTYQSESSSCRKRRPNEKFNETVKLLRTEEEDRIKKRKLFSSDGASQHIFDEQMLGTNQDHHNRKSECTTTSSQVRSTQYSTNETMSSNLFESSFQYSCVPQIITNSGGQIVAWNDSFLKLTGFSPSQVTSYLSVFYTVDPSFLPRLLDLFSFVLRNEESSPVIPGKNTVAKKHHMEKVQPPSVTIPCKSFQSTSTPHNIKVTYMNDRNPIRRCFHCVLYPVEHYDGDALGDSSKVNETKEYSNMNTFSPYDRKISVLPLGKNYI